jgi:hypothetical protein
VSLDYSIPTIAGIDRCVFVSPDRGFPRKPRMGGLGMLLESVEPVQPVRRRDTDQHHLPEFAHEIACGAP